MGERGVADFRYTVSCNISTTLNVISSVRLSLHSITILTEGQLRKILNGYQGQIWCSQVGRWHMRTDFALNIELRHLNMVCTGILIHAVDIGAFLSCTKWHERTEKAAITLVHFDQRFSWL